MKLLMAKMAFTGFIVSMFLVLVGLYWKYYESLPPRTAHKVARAVSDLPITNDAEVETFDEQWMPFLGDGTLQIVLHLTEENFKEVEKACLKEGYNKSGRSIRSYLPLGHNRHRYSTANLVHCFVQKEILEDPGNYELVVLDRKNHLLVIEISVT
ncbi:hypothetical protein [Larkinella soli]|uniref:hypothetical protein n=1 Tax=Larkinella soli TaxID=1770527 RepID=UPI000FFB5489|nr:hypothetical protein [Larkinella soli]